MMRSVLLRLSSSALARRVATRFPPSVRASRRFIAGETLEEALAAAAAANAEGRKATLDYLGENVSSRSEADGYAEAHVRILERIGAAGLDCNVSLKLTGMGLDGGEPVALANLERVLAAAERLGNFVRIDMEGSAYTERTLAVHRQVRGRFANVGVVIQSYLRRSSADVDALIALGASVRLCKGAYREPSEVAFPDKRDVDENYRRLTERLLSAEARDRGVRAAIATHDPAMIAHVKGIVAKRGIPSGAFEFQMLYGVRQDLQAALVREGFTLRVYIPFGEAWYPYFMRRLAERPANVGFVLKNLWRESPK